MKLVFLGANNPQTIREIRVHQAADPELEIVGFLDNDPEKIGSSFHGYPVYGPMSSCGGLDVREVKFLNLITRDCRTRSETSASVARAGGKFTNFIDPELDLHMTEVGTGVYIQDRVVLQAEVRVGDNTAINTGCIVSHETRLGNTVFLAPGCHLAGCVTIGDGVFVGVGATIMPRLRIGDWSVIGAGSVVVRDVEPFTVVAGNPARVIRRLEPLPNPLDISLS